MSISILMALIIIVVGFLIGTVGVGGVLLVPSLVFFGGMEVHQVIPACMASFMLAGIVAVWIYGRRGSIDWRRAGWITLGAVPGAYSGALLLSRMDGLLVLAAVAVLTLAAGIDALRKRRPDYAGKGLKPPALMTIGLITGCGSALTGTGGPLIMVPLLVWLNTPVLAAVGLGQFIQIPISAFATGGNLIHGSVDFVLAATIALLMVLGLVFGARLAHSLPATSLRAGVAWMLILSGSGMLYRLWGWL